MGAAMLLGAFLLRGNSALPAETVLAPLGWLAVAAGAGMRCLLELRLGGRPARRTPVVEPMLQGAEPADTGRLAAARVPVPIDPPPAAPVEGLAWSPALLQSMEWRRFEALCEALMQLQGYATRTQAFGADGGVDIWLFAPGTQGGATSGEHRVAAGIVQCKSWSKPVGEPPVRELLGLRTAHRVSLAMLLSVSGFTEGALAFGRANGLLLLDGADLLGRILACPRETQLRLLAVATEGDYQRPTCVRCGGKMTFRTQAGGTGFWGCERFPLCRHILHARSDEEPTA